jgi:cytochrome b
VRAGATAARGRRTVDAPTRMFHWLFALCFAGAWLSADGERARLVHVTLGYSCAGLLGFRVLWGLAGPRHARLGLMVRRIRNLPAWLRTLPAARPNWPQGRHAATASMIAAILALVLPLTLFGHATYSEWGGEWLATTHEFFGNTLGVVVLGHIGLIALSSALRGRNEARPMLTGRSAGAGPDLVRHNFAVIAWLVCAALLGFWISQWR